MQLLTPSPDIALAGLRALQTVATADGQLHSLERRFLEGVQQWILKTNFDLDALQPIDPQQLAAAVPAGEFRERITSACVVMALIDGETSAAEASVLEKFARALEVSSPALKDVKRLVEQHLTIARIDIARRSFMGQRGRAYLADQGVRGFARTVGALLGIENPSLAARYRALEDKPRGTLGREYFEFVRANGFSLPGEKNAPPEVILFHDCLHVLGGYETVSLEETQIASFQAGVMKKDPVFGLLFMLAQFQLGVQVTPVTAAEKLVADPQLMLEAFVRGTKVNRDLCVDWIPQDDFDRSVEDLRREYNIEPRSTLPPKKPAAVRAVQDHDRLATDWWEGFAKGDVERLVSMFAPDATFWDPRFAPFAGRDKIRMYYEDLLGKTTSWGGVRSAVYVASESAFAVHTRTVFKLRGLDKLIDFPMVGFFSHRDGLVTAYEEYWDTAYMLKQLGIPAFPPSPVHRLT